MSEIFLQLHISEKSGRGVPKITEMYGKDAFSFRENSIVVTIPFERINKVGNKVGKKVGDKKPLNFRRQKIIAEMRDNQNITTAELHNILGVSETAVENNISFQFHHTQRDGAHAGKLLELLQKNINEGATDLYGSSLFTYKWYCKQKLNRCIMISILVCGCLKSRA